MSATMIYERCEIAEFSVIYSRPQASRHMCSEVCVHITSIPGRSVDLCNKGHMSELLGTLKRFKM